MNKLFFVVGLGAISLLSLGGCNHIAEAKKAADARTAAASAVQDAQGPAFSSGEDKVAERGKRLSQ